MESPRRVPSAQPNALILHASGNNTAEFSGNGAVIPWSGDAVTDTFSWKLVFHVLSRAITKSSCRKNIINYCRLLSAFKLPLVLLHTLWHEVLENRGIVTGATSN